jgi:hypothetical protein
MTEPSRYKCPRCNDEMALKFARSHERICIVVTLLEERQIREVLNRLELR